MNNTVDIRVLLEHLIQLLLVGDIAGVELGSLAADELDAVEDFVRGVVEVVDDDDLVVCLEEGEGSEGANVAGATGGMEELAFACSCHWRRMCEVACATLSGKCDDSESRASVEGH